MAECMRVFAAMGKELGQALIYAEDIFKRRGPITLTTGHKAKGLEYDNVIHIDPHLVRTNPAGRPASDQDRNLDYVISTRSKNLLTEVTSEQIEW
jgi:superfamily I DNA/RNA helicase